MDNFEILSRRLEEQMANETDLVDVYHDAAASWQPIYVSLILTGLQCLVCLIIFECSRRSPNVGYVYDRRRNRRPARTPPPLMQLRGACCRGPRRRVDSPVGSWFAFEWWRVRVSDPYYRKASQDEARQRREKQAKRAAGRRELRKQLSINADTKLVQEAERTCYEESPFYDPNCCREEEGDAVEGNSIAATLMTGSLLASDESEATDSSEKEGNVADEKKAPGTDEKPPDIAADAAPVSIDDGGVLVRTDSSSGRSNGSSASSIGSGHSSHSRPSSILRLRPMESEGPHTPLSTISERGSPGRRRWTDSVPDTIGGSERSQRRRVTFGDCADFSTDDSSSDPLKQEAQMGTKESERLAKLRYEKEDRVDWDIRTVSTVSSTVGKFLRDSVLLFQDRAENEEEPPASLKDGSSKQLVVRKVMRRPLNAEQQELLRCIGLDAFMTLRFLKFGLDIAFWCLLFSLVTLIPTFATADTNVAGFFSLTVIALKEESARHWMVVFFSFAQFSYILRRIWVEWELFLPLRHDFLENGDFEKEKYQDQYQKTCLVEYVPRSLRHDKQLHDFFDSVFPGQVQRAEVLLNTEYLRSLIRARLYHITKYEDVYAKKVHNMADYMRALDSIAKSGPIKKCCRKSVMAPRPPKDQRIIVIHRVPRTDMGNAFFQPQTATVSDPRTYDALNWHHDMIGKLNKEIEDEYIRLAMERRRPVEIKKESRLSKWIGWKYVTGADTGRVHSSTAFVEFRTLAMKQQAVQCNITGANRFIEVSPVPDIRAIKWENSHVSRALIEARRRWANLFLAGGLIGWSFLVSAIRNVNDLSDRLPWDFVEEPVVTAILDVYLPALVVEGLVRIIPFIIRAVCIWIRFKASSEIDHYVLLWYFGFRLVTFIFVIVGGTLIDSGDEFIDDPVGFFEHLADNVAAQAQFFISYVIVSGGMQLFFRLSQMHNVTTYWFVNKIIREEALSQRRLEKMRTAVKTFHLDEFIPLFLFIFMVGALYGPLAPLANVFVAAFFKCAYKVFKYMTLFIYDNEYEGGGFLFYSLSSIMFYVLYMLILTIVGYLSLHGSSAMAGVFSIILFVTVFVHMDVNRTFVAPSKTLSLTKARISDECKEPKSLRDRRVEDYLRAKEALTDLNDASGSEISVTRKLLVPDPGESIEMNTTMDESTEAGTNGPPVSTTGSLSVTDTEKKRSAMEKLEMRYQEEEAFSDFTDSDESGPHPDFFIYRQPSLNRATWESAPRPYRGNVDRNDVELWH